MVVENVTRDSSSGYIGPELVVRGRLSGEGDVSIDGQFEGEMSIRGRVVVGATGRVRAPVQATYVGVRGRLEGAVGAADVVVEDGGELLGDVRALSVGLEDGGALHGTVDMDVTLPGDLVD